MQPSHQYGRVHTQPGGHLEQVVQADVALAPLDLTDEGPVNPGLIGQGFLAETQFLALGTDALPEGSGGK